jgi:hypothetical protein
MGDSTSPVARRSISADREQIESFKCARSGYPWEKAAQEIIQKAPVDVPTIIGAEIFVVALDEQIISVAVCSPDREVENVVWVNALGTKNDHKRNGYAKLLKATLIGEYTRANPQISVTSKVHHYNRPMLSLNGKLDVPGQKINDDGKYILFRAGGLLEPVADLSE